jgi:hypothetical protein
MKATMSSNNYNPYSYPYQQSSAQQYSAYQTAPASSNIAQPSRQYQQPATTQVQDYMSYQPQSYVNQSNGYGAGQDSSWNSGSYGGTRETTSRAAEVLRNMSNPSYTSSNSTCSTNQAVTSHSNRYATGTSHSPQAQAQQTHATYGQSQSQPRPRSVNTNRAQPASRGLPSPAMAAGYPSQRTQSVYTQQQQRSASPAQPQYNTVPASTARSAGMTATASHQFNDYSARQLPSVEASRNSQNATSSTSYNYGNAQMPSAAIAPPAPSSSMADTYIAQSTTTVDPMAVYDPWPEYQRKQAAQKAIEDAARAEEERIAQEARKVEEQKKEEERKRQEEADRSRQPKPKAKKGQKQQSTTAGAASAAPAEDDGPGEALEAEIRAMMTKMRELNSKDPALLARIWEEERRAKAPKSPTTQNKAIPQAPAAQPAQATQDVQASTPQPANSRKKTVPKEASKPAAPAVAQAVPVRHAQPTPNRPSGNTVWPPEKKAHLANAAAAYLNAQNGAHRVVPGQILSLLDSNPSYIELCEQLEQMGLKLDRAVFAKSLLTAVPDVNSATRKSVPQPALTPVQKPHVPPAVMKKEVATPVVATSLQYARAVVSPINRGSYPPFPDNGSPAPTPVPVAEMVPIKPELRKPANKEEAARKRNLSDLVDLTQLSEDEDMGPPPKRHNADSMYAFGSPHADAMIVDEEPSTPNFPIANTPTHQPQAPVPQPIQPPSELRHRNYVEPLEKKKALRRNQYNPATIARDVLLACGRHPSERQLNQHLDMLRTTLPQISFDSDLSTIRWDLIDPGRPPPGYFKDSVQALTEDADDEDDSNDEERETRPRAPSNAIGGESGAQARVQALPEAINPFKQKRRGRPPRQSFPDGAGPVTPKRPSNSVVMSSSAPRPTSAAAGVGYQAFRSVTEYGPDGQPLPKKKGRPVGWRKAIHGSAAAQARPNPNKHNGLLETHQPAQPSSLRNVQTGPSEPIRIDSRSPSVANRGPYQSFKCKWQNCKADLHNLDTLKKHVFKVHRKETLGNTLECLWDDCGKEVTNYDPMTNMRIERHQPHSFDLESAWRGHIQQHHFDPISWGLGDGPASGVSGKEDD